MEGIAPGAGGAIAPSPEDQDHLIESFRGVTSASPSEACFFLESHNWQLDAAVHSFFDAADDSPAADTAPLPPAASGRRRRRHQLQEEEEEEGDDEDDEDYVPPADELPQARPATRWTAAAMESSSSKPSKPSRSSGSRPAGGIRTLADLNRQSAAGSDSEDSDVPQEYYTGGEKSGMLVQDPSNPPKGDSFVDSLFEQARQMGATEEESLDSLRPPPSSGSFTGTGRLLSGETVQASPQPPESIIHDVVFWADGFTVNDGPLRRFDDPENASFLESIRRSECPKELEPTDRRAMVHVGLSRRDEKYPEPVKRFNPFGGVGRTLGTGSSSSASPVASAPAAAPSSSPPSAGLSMDKSLPSTSIQLRLADGTRLIARFNYHHTVGDIRAFIDASRPGAARSYQLQTVGFPPKQLTDVSQTIEQAGLANSVVIQKL